MLLGSPVLFEGRWYFWVEGCLSEGRPQFLYC